MTSDTRLILAIRTILVTTRVAFRSNQRAGMEELARGAARSGLEMLERLRQEMPPDAAVRLSRAVGDAERAIRELIATK
ncbi:MAG TPA: hypothetical protein VFP30_06070 [Candidatus Limnocylindria bacterium]|nr:hypothetical protein [Candidatus Limnocylindria bacterium]